MKFTILVNKDNILDKNYIPNDLIQKYNIIKKYL